MTDNEKLIDRLDEEIKNHQSWVDNILELDCPTNEEQEHLDDLAMFTEIKGIVEKAGKFAPHIKKVVIMSSPEPQPQPDEELVVDLLEIGMDYYRDRIRLNEAKAEIRKLLEGTK